MTKPLGVAIVGCGDISRHYLEDLADYPELSVLGVTDLLPDRAREAAARHRLRAYADLAELLADQQVDILVNLTVAAAHADVTARALRAGKHVFSEKPLAVSATEARRLQALASDCDRRLACAPVVPLGHLAASARAVLASGRLGRVRLVYADVNWGRVEVWHDRPEGFYEVGPVFDVGVYPLTLLVSLFGAVRRVTAVSERLMPERATRAGGTFAIRMPDFVLALIELVDGPVVRLTADWYVSSRDRQRGVTLHGDAGSLWLSNWFQFEGTLEFMPFDGDPQPVPLAGKPTRPLQWGYGVADLVQAISSGQPHAATAERAAHVVEIVEAIHRSAETGRPVSLTPVDPLGLRYPAG